MQRCWTDRRDRRVEQFLNSFVRGVYRAAESLGRERIDAEKRRWEQQELELRRQEEEQRRQKERAEQERLRQEADRRRRDEEACMQELHAEVSAWTKAQQIRAFLAPVRLAHENCGGVAPNSDLDHWLKWAERHANTLDPLTRPPING